MDSSAHEYARQKEQNISIEQVLAETYLTKMVFGMICRLMLKRPYGRCLHAAVPKATCTYALTLMVKVGGWSDEKSIGPKFAVCVRIYTKAVCKKNVVVNRLFGESKIWETEVCLWEHEWITDTDVTLKENEKLEALNYEIEVPCPLQWGLLWFSAPTNLNQKFMNNGTNIEKFRNIVNHAIELSCKFVFERTHTP